MHILVIFTSEEEGTEDILKILVNNQIDRGVVIDSRGMKKVLGINMSTEQLFSIFAERRHFNKTIMAVVPKDNVRKIIDTINRFWAEDKKNEKERKKNRVMFSLPIENLTIGI